MIVMKKKSDLFRLYAVQMDCVRQQPRAQKAPVDPIWFTPFILLTPDDMMTIEAFNKSGRTFDVITSMLISLSSVSSPISLDNFSLILDLEYQY